MKEFMKDYDALTERATGLTYVRRPLSETQTVEDICGCELKTSLVMTRNEFSVSFRKEFEEHIKEELIDEPMEGPIEETDEQMDSKMPITSANEQPHPISPNPVPQIWQQKHTVCMEEIE